MKKRQSLWLVPIAALCLPLLALVVYAAANVGRVAPVLAQSAVGDDLWIEQLSTGLESQGVIVFSKKIDANDPDLHVRVLRLSVSDRVGSERPDAYRLVSGIHLLLITSWEAATIRPAPIDWVYLTISGGGDQQYSVLVPFEDLQALASGQLTEAEYYARWQVAGNAPSFAVPGR